MKPQKTTHPGHTIHTHIQTHIHTNHESIKEDEDKKNANLGQLLLLLLCKSYLTMNREREK